MRDHGRAVCGAALRKVDGDLAQLVLATAVGAVAIIVENFYA